MDFNGSNFICDSQVLHVVGVPSHVLQVESHSIHYPLISTLISAGHASVQLPWKKNGNSPSASHEVQEVTIFSQVMQLSAHGMHSFELGFSIKPSGHSTRHCAS